MHSEGIKVNIPAVNLYNMMCYKYLDIGLMNVNDFTDNKYSPIETMLSSVLLQGITRLINKGIYKEYIGAEGLIPILRGKIDISQTIKLKTQISRQVYCHYDEFSEDNIYNQILKAFCLLILKRGRVNERIRKRAKKMMYSFCNVTDISLGGVVWGRLSFEKNKFHYKSLITIGHILYKDLYLNRETGEEYLEVNTAQKIYSEFIFNVYDRECDDISVRYDKVTTDQLGGTDFILKGKESSMVLHTSLFGRLYNGNEGISSKEFLLSEIRRMFKNIDGSKMGIVNSKYLLLYPSKAEAFMEEHDVNGNVIYIASVDLSRPIEEVIYRLKSVCKLI